MLTTRRGMRVGASLAELLVALTLAATILGTATSSLLRQRRTASAIDAQAASSAQLRAATGALRAELSVLGQGTGDLVPGETRDTSLQIRMHVVSGVACADATGAATFAEDDDGTSPSSGATPKAGDTLWWFAGASQPAWRARRIISSDHVSVPCMLTGAPTRPARRVSVGGSDTIPLGALLRVTRPARYSFYRSGDGSWQLGFREWLEASGRFAPPQPIAGPFVIRADDARSGFRYFGVGGGELTAASEETSALVTRVRLSVLAADPWAGGTGAGIRRDSVDVALQSTRTP